MKRSALILSAFLTLAACTAQPTADRLAAVQTETPTELMQAIAAGDNRRALKLIGSAPLNVHTSEVTALDQAARKGQDDVVLALLRAGAAPDAGLVEGRASALHVVAERGQVALVRALIAAGAPLEVRDAEGRTPLAVALMKGHLPTAKALIKAGSDVNATYGGQSLLMHVVARNSLLMTQLLVDSGADVNYRGENGETALSLAQAANLQDVGMLLVHSGANP